MTVWCAGLMRLHLIQSCTPNGHLYRVTYTRCCIDTINSPDDGHMAARNMWRIEINVHEKEVCVKLVKEMHGQQNVYLLPNTRMYFVCNKQWYNAWKIQNIKIQKYSLPGCGNMQSDWWVPRFISGHTASIF
jgi:hypothetical protein